MMKEFKNIVHFEIIACFHDQNKSVFLEARLLKLWLAGKKPALQKSHFCFDHVNRLYICLNIPSSDIWPYFPDICESLWDNIFSNTARC